MGNRAFVPAPLVEAQPRVYKSFRARQLYGIVLGFGGAGLSVALVGASDLIGFSLMFLASLPGFAFGYYQPNGKPLEFWVRVWWRYWFTLQRLGYVPGDPTLRLWAERARCAQLAAAILARRLRLWWKGRRAHG